MDKPYTPLAPLTHTMSAIHDAAGVKIASATNTRNTAPGDADHAAALLTHRYNSHDALVAALELAQSHIREHDDHVGDCQLSQSDGDDPCSCDHGFTLTQIDVALKAAKGET